MELYPWVHCVGEVSIAVTAFAEFSWHCALFALWVEPWLCLEPPLCMPALQENEISPHSHCGLLETALLTQPVLVTLLPSLVV